MENSLDALFQASPNSSIPNHGCTLCICVCNKIRIQCDAHSIPLHNTGAFASTPASRMLRHITSHRSPPARTFDDDNDDDGDARRARFHL